MVIIKIVFGACVGIIMRKAVYFGIVAIFFCKDLWAADFSLSTGGGGLIGGLFTRYKSSSTSSSQEMTQEVNQVNFGGLVFFDATYGELVFTYQRGVNNYTEVMASSSQSDFVERAGEGWETMIGIGLLGKYPFSLTDRLKLFPLLGMEYQVARLQRRRQDGVVYDRADSFMEQDNDGNKFDISTWNSFWIHLGIGADFYVKKDFFLRGELLYSFRLMTSYEKDGLEQLKTISGDNDPKLSGLTSGPSLRLSAGYRFWAP